MTSTAQAAAVTMIAAALSSLAIGVGWLASSATRLSPAGGLLQTLLGIILLFFAATYWMRLGAAFRYGRVLTLALGALWLLLYLLQPRLVADAALALLLLIAAALSWKIDRDLRRRRSRRPSPLDLPVFG